MTWLDTGSCDSLHEACGYICTLEHRHGLKVGCTEEVDWCLGWINNDQIEQLAQVLEKNSYGSHLMQLPKENASDHFSM